MSTYTGHDGPQRRQALDEGEHNRRTEEPVSAQAQGPQRPGSERQLPLSRFVQRSLALMLAGQLAVMHINFCCQCKNINKCNGHCTVYSV